MIKITALNKESEEESRSEEDVTREALEQIALQQYSKALELQRKGNIKDATQLLTDLLDTELLDTVKKPIAGEKAGPLFMLKYLCYKNLSSMLSTENDVEGAINACVSASELDATDITLWHRLGMLYICTSQYENALYAFRRGNELNPKHWPCLDKIVTLLLGLDYKEECITTIYDHALKLDPSYMRGIVYRKYIYSNYPYIRDFMQYVNPIYKWDEQGDELLLKDFPSNRADLLIKEAEQINETYIAQQKQEQFPTIIPHLKLQKKITQLTWECLGESLVHMHKYMTDNCYSHACPLEMVFELEENPKEVIEEIKEVETAETKIEEQLPAKFSPEGEQSDAPEKEKATVDIEKNVEKVESDVEMVAAEAIIETCIGAKKKAPVRRRGSALSFLQQWEWCNKRRSGRKKTDNKQDLDDNIYDLLRKMVPYYLAPETIRNEEESDKKEEYKQKEGILETSECVEQKLEEMKQKSEDIIQRIGDFKEDEEGARQNTNVLKSIMEKKDSCSSQDPSIIPEETQYSYVEENKDYFGSESESKDVKQFIEEYTTNKCDIIDIFRHYLHILARKWNVKWPEKLPEVFVSANKCYREHVSTPAFTEEDRQDLLHYTVVNLLAEEFVVNEKLNSTEEAIKNHEFSVSEYIKMILTFKPNIFKSPDLLEFMLRLLWVNLHIHVLNKCEEFALDCLYQLMFEFEAMGEYKEKYCLEIVNFTFKPCISLEEVYNYINFLERNKKLATVMDLHESGHHEEVLSILMDSFKHYKEVGKKQEDEMSLDFAAQLVLILDSMWALNKVDLCFKWALTCLHEALAHYFRFTSGSADYDKWTLTVFKIVSCMEHILTNEGLVCLETVSRKELGQGLEDLIRIIGHQVETNAADMPFKTVTPWIIFHYILQREEDQGKVGINKNEDVPNPLLVLFIAHEQLGSRGWCCQENGKLLYFILDQVVPRLRSPSLSKSLEQICQYMEQCVYCLFGHPSKKNKLKYLTDHNVSPHPLDWQRTQQLYEIYRPPTLPALEGKIPGITADTEQLFHRILALLPKELDPQKYVSEIEKYIKGVENKLPTVPLLLPYKMRDIYFLLGDYYFKKEEGKMAIKFNILDVIINQDRLESWAQISLAKAVNLERLLNSCKNINNEKEFLNPAKAIIRCFKRSLELDPSHCNMWIEYGMFVYTVHSFCSRLLKQASESLSMESFESLEKQKEDMLDTTQKCFMTVLNDSENLIKNGVPFGDDDEDAWLHYYMLGKVAEKRNRPPSEYLGYYMQGVKSLQETDATYPLKINYSSPTHLCIEVLELHYRIHASILKYIEQHENKPIPASVGKVFSSCIEEWRNGPFTKKPKKDGVVEPESKSKQPEVMVHPANIFKRSASDVGEVDSTVVKKQKIESAAAKVKRSASYTDRTFYRCNKNKKDNQKQNETSDDATKVNTETTTAEMAKSTLGHDVSDVTVNVADGKETNEKLEVVDNGMPIEKTKVIDKEKKGHSSSSSSSSSSESSSSESSSDSSSESSRDSNTSTVEKPLTDDEIMAIVHACLDALEDCASRFPPHYKAIYRLAHYHFYYKKGKNIERCRDLMLSNFISRAGPKLAGLFSERKHSNFFNNIWKIPLSEVDRAGGFAFHMSRSVLLTMEILKEIDDNKTLLDLSLHLQRIPELDKKYLRDSDREELSQQAFSLCVQSLKGQLLKFSQQEDLNSNDVERQALKSLMLDIYRAYQRVQKQPSSKQFTNLLVDAYKLVSTTPLTENMNLVDLSMRYCQSIIQTLKQQATQASLDKSQITQKKQSVKTADTVKVSTLIANQPKTDAKPSTVPPPVAALPQSASSPLLTAQDLAASLQNYLPVLNDPILTTQTAAAISYLNNISALAGYPPIQSPLQNSLQNTFQAEFYRQFITQSLASYNLSPPKPKQKRGPKPGSSRTTNMNRLLPKMSKPMQTAGKPRSTAVTGLQIKRPTHSSSLPSISKPSTSVSGPISSSVTAFPKSSTSITAFPKSSTSMTGLPKTSPASLAPSMGTVLSSLPPSMSMNLSSFGGSSSLPQTSGVPTQAHTSSASTISASSYTKPPLPHQSARSGKTLQEKLAERQKIKPPIGNALSKLPSSVTVTKTTVYKPPQPKKANAGADSSHRNKDVPRPMQLTEEIIVLDDD